MVPKNLTIYEMCEWIAKDPLNRLTTEQLEVLGRRPEASHGMFYLPFLAIHEAMHRGGTITGAHRATERLLALANIYRVHPDPEYVAYSKSMEKSPLAQSVFKAMNNFKNKTCMDQEAVTWIDAAEKALPRSPYVRALRSLGLGTIQCTLDTPTSRLLATVLFPPTHTPPSSSITQQRPKRSKKKTSRTKTTSKKQR